MQQYIKDFFKSRNTHPSDQHPCEMKPCSQVTVDIHHLTQSMRGKRKHDEDGSDLIGLCRGHHDWIHNHNSFENREKLLERVENILDRKNKLGM